MFGKETFDSLEPKEQRCIYRDMERKAVMLHNKYVDEERMANRRRRRTSRALAPFYEAIYRQNLFERIKAAGEQPEPGFDAIISTNSTIVTDSEYDISQETVINTATQKSNNNDPNNIDENDRSILSENRSRRNSLGGGYRVSRTIYTITQNFEMDELLNSFGENNGIIGSECNVSSTHTEYHDDVSEGVVSSSQDSYYVGASTPDIPSQELLFGTPCINRRNEVFNGSIDGGADTDTEPDTLDFLSQRMDALTSTQQ